MMEEEPLGYRVGIFFIFVGLLTLIPFVASDQLKSPDYRYFFTAFFLLVIGGILLWKNRPQRPQSATRFRLFKRKSKEKRKE